jgi:hypothetical protein
VKVLCDDSFALRCKFPGGLASLPDQPDHAPCSAQLIPCYLV